MNKIVIGKYVNTHGIKGEIRIISNFAYKNRVFKVGNEIIINDIVYKICSYRVHKVYDMVTLNGIDDINKIPFSKNSLVYIDKDKYLNDNDCLDSDLIGYIVYNSKIKERVLDIVYMNYNKKLIKTEKRYIPFELIFKIDKSSKYIYIKEVDGL